MQVLTTPNKGAYVDCTDKAWCAMATLFLNASQPCVLDKAFIPFINAMARVVYPDWGKPVAFNRDDFNTFVKRYNALDLIGYLNTPDNNAVHPFNPHAKYFCYLPAVDKFYSADTWVVDLPVVRGRMSVAGMTEILRTLWHGDKAASFDKFFEGTKDLYPLMVSYAREYLNLRTFSDAGVCSRLDRFDFVDFY